MSGPPVQGDPLVPLFSPEVPSCPSKIISITFARQEKRRRNTGRGSRVVREKVGERRRKGVGGEVRRVGQG